NGWTIKKRTNELYQFTFMGSSWNHGNRELMVGCAVGFFFWILAKIIGRGSPTFNYYLALSMLLLFTVGNIYITYDATTQASLRIDNDIPRSIAHPLAGFSIGDR